MKALNTLRNLIFLLFFAAAAASASATDGTVKRAKAHPGPKAVTMQRAMERTANARRKEVAPFVDPTLPLTELVERVRTERTR